MRRDPHDTPRGRAEERHRRDREAIAAEERYLRSRASAYQAMWLLR